MFQHIRERILQDHRIARQLYAGASEPRRSAERTGRRRIAFVGAEK